LAEHPDIASISTEADTNPYIIHNSNLYPPVEKLTGHKLSAVHIYVRDRFGVVACPVIFTYRNNKLSEYISMILGVRDGFWSVSHNEYYDIIVAKQKQHVKHRQYNDKKMRLNIDGALNTIGGWRRSG
jgi:hypothetical protein